MLSSVRSILSGGLGTLVLCARHERDPGDALAVATHGKECAARRVFVGWWRGPTAGGGVARTADPRLHTGPSVHGAAGSGQRLLPGEHGHVPACGRSAGGLTRSDTP